MSKFSDYSEKKGLSKGGLIGGIMGALASSASYSGNDSTLKKAGKTGLFAALGYFIGEWVEKLIGKRRS